MLQFKFKYLLNPHLIKDISNSDNTFNISCHFRNTILFYCSIEKNNTSFQNLASFITEYVFQCFFI